MATLQRTQAIPLADYPSGTQNLPVTSVPDTANFFYLEIQRCTSATPTIWPNEATTLTIDLEISYDNGVTWQDFAGYQDSGGIVINHNGVEQPNSVMQAPMEPGTKRKLRGTVVIANGPLRTQGFYEARS